MKIGSSFTYNYSDIYQSNKTIDTDSNKKEAVDYTIDNSSTNTKTESNQKENDKENKNTEIVNGKELEPDEVEYVRELEKIDQNVKAHESAHIAAGAGIVTGGASYSYTRGPDGKMYATAGEVPIAMEKGDTPEETIQNARKIVAAAMAPSDPSPQDYKVAASAMQMETQARAEMARESQEELKKDEKERQNKSQENKSVDSSTETNKYNTNHHAISTYIKNQNNNISSPLLEIAG